MQEFSYQGVTQKNQGLVADDDKKELPKDVKDIELVSQNLGSVNVM